MAKLKGADAEMANEVMAVLSKYGYHCTRYFISKGEGTSRLTLNVNNPTADGTKASPSETYAREYKARCTLEGFRPEWLGAELPGMGKLVGFRGGRTKRSLVYSKNGKLYVTEPETWRALFEAREAKAKA